MPVFALALAGCFDEPVVEPPVSDPFAVEYSVEYNGCFATESFRINYGSLTRFDSLHACISAGGFELCTDTKSSGPPVSKYSLLLESDRFAEDYRFTYRMFRNRRLADSGGFPVRGKPRADVERVPQRIVFHFRGDSLEWDFHIEDSTYWSNLFLGTERMKSGSELFLNSASGIDSAVMTGLPRAQDYRIRDIGPTNPTGLPVPVPVADRYHLDFGKDPRHYAYTAGAKEDPPDYRHPVCLEMKYEYTQNATVYREIAPNLIPEFQLRHEGSTIVFDSSAAGGYFYCGQYCQPLERR